MAKTSLRRRQNGHTWWGVGAGVSAVLARGAAAREALAPFARVLLRRGALAWALALVIAVAPIARFAVVSGGASLFHGP